MSLLNLIFGQKIIVITLGAAFAMLVLALTLTMIGRMRTQGAKRAKQKARQAAIKAAETAAAAAAAAAEEPESAPPEAVPVRSAQAGGRAPAVAAQMTAGPKTAPTAPAGVKAPQAPGAKPAATPAAPAAPATETAAAPAPAVNAMQDILSAVFVDDEAMARYTVLLKGLDSIEISGLLTLCQQIAGQLGIDRASSAVSKEL